MIHQHQTPGTPSWIISYQGMLKQKERIPGGGRKVRKPPLEIWPNWNTKIGSCSTAQTLKAKGGNYHLPITKFCGIWEFRGFFHYFYLIRSLFSQTFFISTDATCWHVLSPSACSLPQPGCSYSYSSFSPLPVAHFPFPLQFIQHCWAISLIQSQTGASQCNQLKVKSW